MSLSLYIPLLVLASIPNEMIYEGRMLSKTGEKLEGSYTLRFSFWKSGDFTTETINEDGTINSSLEEYSNWKEEIPITFNDSGYFSAFLGRTLSLEKFPISEYKYLQVEIKKTEEELTEYQLLDVNGDNGADQNDRKIIASVPYAKHANSARNASGSTFTIDPENIIHDAETGFIKLEFGNSLSKFLKYDIDINRFVFSDDVEIKGDLIITSNAGSAQISAQNLTADRTITLLDEDATLVGQDNTQELTNKTIDAKKNTIINLDIESLPEEERVKTISPSYPSTILSTNTENKFISLYTIQDGINTIYKISSRKNTIQQGMFTTKISLPDFSTFGENGKVTLQIKTTSENSSENSISIEVLDSEGVIIGSLLDQTSENPEISTSQAGEWKTIEISLPESFIPKENTFIIQITPKTTKFFPVFIGKLSTSYKGR